MDKYCECQSSNKGYWIHSGSPHSRRVLWDTSKGSIFWPRAVLPKLITFKTRNGSFMEEANIGVGWGYLVMMVIDWYLINMGYKEWPLYWKQLLWRTWLSSGSSELPIDYQFRIVCSFTRGIFFQMEWFQYKNGQHKQRFKSLLSLLYVLIHLIVPLHPPQHRRVPNVACSQVCHAASSILDSTGTTHGAEKAL